MDEINAIAQKHGLRVLEDAAQAGARRSLQRRLSNTCGAIGDIASFSFFPSKNLGTYGGRRPCDDQRRHAGRTGANACVRMAQRRRYIHDEIGYNSRLEAIQAVILGIKVPHATNGTTRAARMLRITTNSRRPAAANAVERDGCRHVYHQYTLRVPQREQVSEALTVRKSDGQFTIPVPMHPTTGVQSAGLWGRTFPRSSAPRTK
jgi:dTDP-4-amino-4,6-dideoxygalactose transaminase